MNLKEVEGVYIDDEGNLWVTDEFIEEHGISEKCLTGEKIAREE